MIIDAPNPSRTGELRTLWKAVFGDSDAFLDAFWKTAFSEDRCLCAVMDDRVVAALYWFDCSASEVPLAYLYAIGTAEEYRGRGICRRLMAYTHELLAARGYRGALLVPGNEGLFAMYRGMGYEVCGKVRELSVVAADAPVELRQIDAAEYARLRRQYLPQGGVIQENENLSFLKTRATLYAGTDFVLAAERAADTLLGLEMLGNVESASGIVRAVGCRQGRFRTHGKEREFAMFRELGEEKIVPPSYFGLAFD